MSMSTHSDANIPAQTNTSATTFYCRLALLAITPVLHLTADANTIAIVVSVALAITLVMDFRSGRTTWIPGRAVFSLFILIAYPALVFALLLRGQFHVWELICVCLFAVILSSDAITNSSRWKLLLPVGIISAVPAVLPYIFSSHLGLPHNTLLKPVLVYSTGAFVAVLVRLFFPRTKHLLHTSLDYRYARIEILSFGMKRIIAFGLRKP